MSDGTAIPALHRSPSALAGSILRNRNFILLWCAYTVSALGDHLSEVALLDMQNAIGRDDSTRIMSMMMFAFFLPFFVFGPTMGWLADRLPRKWIMVTADATRVVLLLALFPVLQFLFRALEGSSFQLAETHPQGGSIYSPWVYCTPLMVLGVFAAMFSPSRAAMLPTLVRQDQIVRANGLMNAMGPIAAIASYALGTHLVLEYGNEICFRADALTFLISAVFILFMIPPRRAAVSSAGTSRVEALRDGFAYCRTHRRVIELIVFMVLFWTAAIAVRSMMPALVKGVFGGGLSDIKNYYLALGIGMLTGAFIIGAFGEAIKSEVAISWSFMGAGLAVLALALVFVRQFGEWSGAACLFVCGMFGSGILVSANALLQKTVPDFMLGRVIGVKDFASMGGLLLATGALGIPRWTNIDAHVPWLLAIIGLTLFVAGMRATRVRLQRGRFRPIITFWRNFIVLHNRIVARVRRKGICTVPQDGPVIVAANHNSAIDPFLLISTSPNRYLSFMIAREFTGIPLVSYLARLAECIPVNRTGVDIASVKSALRHLSAGKAIGIFPQGRIVAPDDWENVQEGVGMLALRSGATIIPAYISGTHYSDNVYIPYFLPQRAIVHYGKPIDLSPWSARTRDRAAYREVAQHIIERIKSLRPQEPLSE